MKIHLKPLRKNQGLKSIYNKTEHKIKKKKKLLSPHGFTANFYLVVKELITDSARITVALLFWGGGRSKGMSFLILISITTLLFLKVVTNRNAIGLRIRTGHVETELGLPDCLGLNLGSAIC